MEKGWRMNAVFDADILIFSLSWHHAWPNLKHFSTISFIPHFCQGDGGAIVDDLLDQSEEKLATACKRQNLC